MGPSEGALKEEEDWESIGIHKVRQKPCGNVAGGSPSIIFIEKTGDYYIILIVCTQCYNKVE